MENGIYHIKFVSSIQGSGEGLVAISGDSVNGGDLGYLYQSHLHSEGDKVSGKIHVKRWNPGHKSVFGPLEELDLVVNGSFKPGANSFDVSGEIEGQPTMKIGIQGRFLSPLA